MPVEALLTQTARDIQYARFARMVGRTPLLPITASNDATIWAKMEFENPVESHYDRVAPVVLKLLEDRGIIKPGDTILEGTSGSAGRSFAYFCSRLGYNLDLIVPVESEFPEARLRDIRALGANIIRADEVGGIGKITRKMQKMMVQLRRTGFEEIRYEVGGQPVFIYSKDVKRICVPNHSEIEITPQVFGAIGAEVLRQLPEGVVLDTFVSALGNGSTTKGISEALRIKFPDLQVVGYETPSAPTNAIRKIEAELDDEGITERQVREELLRERFMARYGFRMPERNEQTYHDSFGLSTPGYRPPFIDVRSLADIVILDESWRDEQRRWNMNSWEHYDDINIIGNTSAEALSIARKRAQERTAKNILILFYDKKDQYPDWPPFSYRSSLVDMGDYVRFLSQPYRRATIPA